MVIVMIRAADHTENEESNFSGVLYILLLNRSNGSYWSVTSIYLQFQNFYIVISNLSVILPTKIGSPGEILCSLILESQMFRNSKRCPFDD
jgi:hypothetical protein